MTMTIDHVVISPLACDNCGEPANFTPSEHPDFTEAGAPIWAVGPQCAECHTRRMKQHEDGPSEWKEGVR